MNKQLQKLTEEMVNEIKNLKDFTKAELPEIAKEYIRYNLIVSMMLGIVFGMFTLLGIILMIYGWSITPVNYQDINAPCGLGSAMSIFAGIGASINLHNYLQFKL